MQTQELVSSLSELVAYQTTAEKPEAIAACVEAIDAKMSFFPFVRKDYKSSGVASTVWCSEDTLAPRVMLYAHIDVVPAPEELFDLKQNGDILRGRGVSDMKFAIPAYIEAMKRVLHENGDKFPCSVGMMIVSDEEMGGFNGAKYLVESIGYRPDVVVMPDGDDNWHITTEAKGGAWVDVEATGVTAHASEPWAGKNAIVTLMKVLLSLTEKFPSRDPNGWETTVNVGKIEGGTQPNQVPDRAKATVDFRFVPTDLLKNIVAALADENPEISFRVRIEKCPFMISPDNPYLLLWKQAMEKIVSPDCLPETIYSRENGSADHHFFSAKGIPVVLAKPIGGNIHSNDEWLSLSSLSDFTEVMVEYINLVSNAEIH